MIQEMLSADGEEATVESVLLKLGPPKELAKNTGTTDGIWLARNILTTILGLRIVLLCVGLSVVFQRSSIFP